MSKTKQNLITIGGALFLFIIFSVPLTKLDLIIFRSGSGGGFGDIGPEIPNWVDAFSYAFPFFLSLLEFFFKKPLSQRRPYLYIIGFFIFVSLVDSVFLLATVAVIILGALPGTLFNWWKSKNQNVG